MLNLLYCFDQNYNLQSSISILSFLDNVEEKVNICILHDDPDTFDIKIFQNHHMLNKLNIVRFEKDPEQIYPNIKDNHISVATYFRLHLNQYFDENYDHFIYIDSDVICLRNPLIKIKEALLKLKQSKFKISVKTIGSKEDGYSNIPEVADLNLINGKYFNAGVMIIDFSKWLAQNTTLKLLNCLDKNQDKILFWDQDVLNIFFDGDYLELPDSLNYEIRLEDNPKLNYLDDILLLHYSGSFKPWTVRGALRSGSKFYQNKFENTYDKFHITHSWKLSSLLHLILGVLNLSFFRFKKRTKFLKNFVESIYHE